jgi:hypothetical protein
VCFIVHSSQDHLRTGTRDLDHPISCRCKKTPMVGALGKEICSVLFLDEVLMVPSSSIAVAANCERLTCGGFSLGEPVCLRNFEFITNYFNGLSLSHKRGNEGAIFVGSTHNGASTPQWAMIEDSPEEFLATSSGEGSFSHLSPRWQSMEAHVAPTTTTIWKENALATMTFPPQTAVPGPKTNHPSERHRDHHEGQPAQFGTRHPHVELGSASK